MTATCLWLLAFTESFNDRSCTLILALSYKSRLFWTGNVNDDFFCWTDSRSIKLSMSTLQPSGDQTNMSRELLCMKSFIYWYLVTEQAPEIIFTVLQVAGGQALLPLLTLTILFSSRIKRHPVFINFCFSWIFSSVVFCILCVSPFLIENAALTSCPLLFCSIYAGFDQDNADASDTTFRNSCVAQASLANGVQGL